MATETSFRNPARPFGNPFFREIHKNSWLTKLPNTDQKKKKERMWIVFCVHDDTEAFLEAYIDNKTAALHKPEWFVSLNSTRHISPTICPKEQEYVFVVTLPTENVRLAAPSWDFMLDWVECLHDKLVDLKVLTPKENLYSKLPAENANATSPASTAVANLLPTRDPTSPLPPTPSQNTQAQTSRVNSVTIIPVNGFNTSTPDNTETSHDANSYDSVFNFPPNAAQTSAMAGTDSTQLGEPSSPLQASPQLQPSLPLREQQAMQLRQEMDHSAGVRLQLRRRDFAISIALADAFDAVWICGWNQKEHPILYNTLHIGDRLVSVEGITVQSGLDVHHTLRSVEQRPYVTVVVRRIPFGMVFVLHREVEGQSLGLLQDGNTATLGAVVKDGLAARHGLPPRARTCDGKAWTRWVLTEVNGRPLNLFFKESEVKDRLNSVGRDISILVQPLDLIKQLKKQLKTMRNYKDYIVQ